MLANFYRNFYFEYDYFRLLISNIGNFFSFKVRVVQIRCDFKFKSSIHFTFLGEEKYERLAALLIRSFCLARLRRGDEWPRRFFIGKVFLFRSRKKRRFFFHVPRAASYPGQLSAYSSSPREPIYLRDRAFLPRCRDLSLPAPPSPVIYLHPRISTPLQRFNCSKLLVRICFGPIPPPKEGRRSEMEEVCEGRNKKRICCEINPWTLLEIFVEME